MLPTSGGWHVAEVKNTGSVKPYHHADLATQLWVMRGVGVSVTRATIRHVDTRFVLTRDQDYDGLFVDADLAEPLEPLIASRGEVVAAARATLAGAEPVHTMGAHCDAPFSCSFKPYCGRDLPPPPARVAATRW